MAWHDGVHCGGCGAHHQGARVLERGLEEVARLVVARSSRKVRDHEISIVRQCLCVVEQLPRAHHHADQRCATITPIRGISGDHRTAVVSLPSWW